MKMIFKLIKWLLVVIVALGVVLFFARNAIARRAVEAGMKQKTGFPLEIGAVDVGLFSGMLDMRDLKLQNSPEFEEKAFADVPLLHVDYDTMSMLSEIPHVKELVLNIKELVIVKNQKGETNATKLKGKVSGSSDSGSAGTTSGSGGSGGTPPKEEKAKRYHVDLLKVHVGTVIIKDYSKGKPTERKLTLNVDATYKDISESTDITALVVNAALNQISGAVGDVLKGVGEALKGGTGTFQKTRKSLLDMFKKKE